MQESNRITLLGVIIVNFKTNSPQNQFKTNSEVILHITYIHTSHYTYKLSQLTETPTKQTMIAAEEAVLTKALALLSPLQIFRRIPKCFDTLL